jgi:glycosyltransferase involved in cell wall biosynthesis
MARVVALVPAFNEAEKVGDTVRALLNGPAGKVFVVDDGSSDATAEESGKAGASVLKLEENLGKGGALERAFIEAGPNYDVYLLIDADTGTSAAEASKLSRVIESDEADMAIAILPRKQGTGGFGFVLKLARRILQRRAGLDAQAPLSGQRALNAKALNAVRPLAAGYGMEVAMTVDAAAAGLRIVETPAAFSHSYTYRNTSGFVHRGRQFFDILKLYFRKSK